MKIFLIYIFLYLLPRVCIGENIDFDKYNHQTCSYLNNKLSIFKKMMPYFPLHIVLMMEKR